MPVMMTPPAGPPPVCPNPRDGLRADTYFYSSNVVPIGDTDDLAPIMLAVNPQRVDFFPTGEGLQALALVQNNFGTKFTGFIQVGAWATLLLLAVLLCQISFFACRMLVLQ